MRPRLVLCVVAAFVGMAILPGLAAHALQSNLPKPAYGPQALWGGIAGPIGWGFTQATVTNPGPTITPVAPGESVSLVLSDADGFGHTFWVDYNRNNITEPSEPVSPPFGSSVSFVFFATTTAGQYWYQCSLHRWNMRGRFVVQAPANAPPTIRLTNPNGVVQNDWTGGSVHNLQWTMADTDDPVPSLTVWLNYSYNAGATRGTIAGPLTGLPSPASFPWTVPLIDATDVQVLAEVHDPAGVRGTDSRIVPIIDSAPPTVVSVIPGDGATAVPVDTQITVTFSEPMNTTATQAAFSLAPAVAGLSFSWQNGGRTMIASHASPFAGSTTYTATIGAGAKDVSDPGNPLAGPGPNPWSFTTANAAPQVTVTQPVPGIDWSGGSAHTLQWTASDAEDPPGALTVWVNYSATGAAPWTGLCGPFSGATTSCAPAMPFDDTTTAALNFTAVDSAGARTSTLVSPFTVDSTPPSVTSVSPPDGATNVPLNAPITLTFSEPIDLAKSSPSLTLTPLVTGLSLVWSNGDRTLTVSHNAFAPSTMYTATISGIIDGSDPGNPMPPFSWTFTTGVAPDTTPPTIANVAATPPTAPSGGTVEVSANVTDSDAVASVVVNVILPDATTVNQTMMPVGNRYAYSRPWTLLGTYPFTVWASDMSANWASAFGTFMIAAIPDTTPPTIATLGAMPLQAGQGGTVEIYATITDDVAVTGASVNVTVPDGTHVNQTMTATGNRYAFTRTWTLVGLYPFIVWASDAAGNWASGSDHFGIVDTTPPEIRHTPPSSPIPVGQAVEIAANVTDRDSAVLEVRLLYTPIGGTQQNDTTTLQAGAFRGTIPAQASAGEVRYRIAARDGLGNWNVTAEYALTIQATTGPPPTDYTLFVAAGLVGLVLAVAVAAALWRRRRKKGPAATAPEGDSAGSP